MAKRYKQRKVLSIVGVNDLWRGSQRGATPREISQALAASRSAVRLVVVGRRDVAPAPPRRAAGAVTLAEGEEISRGLA